MNMKVLHSGSTAALPFTVWAKKPSTLKLVLKRFRNGQHHLAIKYLVNPAGKYMPGKPVGICLITARASVPPIGVMCSGGCPGLRTTPNGLQLQNSIQNTFGDSVDAGNHQAVALRRWRQSASDQQREHSGRQNTFFVTNRRTEHPPIAADPGTLVTNSYIEGDGYGLRSWRGGI